MAHFNTVIAEHPDWELAGIYADEGISGTQVKNRVQFQQMIEDAKAKKIDLILTKSISRFARNVVDCLTNIRLLRSLRPPVSVYFDKERLDSLDEKAEVFLTMLASFAQEDIDKASMTIKVTLNAGHQMNYHSHQHRDEVWTVIAGNAGLQTLPQMPMLWQS